MKKRPQRLVILRAYNTPQTLWLDSRGPILLREGRGGEEEGRKMGEEEENEGDGEEKGWE